MANVYHYLMMFTFKRFIQLTAAVSLSVLLLSSCEKRLPVPEEVILKAVQHVAPDDSTEPTGHIVGEALQSDGNFGVKGKPIYPIRTVFEVSRKVPVEWDELTGLPRLPQERETARLYVEIEYTENEFGEWSSRYRTKSWIDPVKEPRLGHPQPEDINEYSTRYQRAVTEVDLKRLESLLNESRKKDELNGGGESRETLVRAAWVSSVAQAKEEIRMQAEMKRKAPATKDHPFINSLGMRFVPVKIGKQDESGYTVLFSIWETRSRDFAAFVKETAYYAGEEWMEAEFQDIPVGRGPYEKLEDSNHPVVFMSKDYGEAFCRWLTQRELKDGLIEDGYEYRLPTDTEWSYAVGIGEMEDEEEAPSVKSERLKHIFPWGEGYPPFDKIANFADMSSAALFDGHIEGYRDGFPTTAPVGSYAPNQFGLHDMAGNVFEVTSSVYDSENGVNNHVVRGSSWLNHHQEHLHSSLRMSDIRGDRRGTHGFRCVLARKTGDSAN